MFYCKIPARVGGSTSLIRSDIVYDWINKNYPKVMKKFETLGVKYLRTVPGVDDFSSP